jgi:hypothetical protein
MDRRSWLIVFSVAGAVLVLALFVMLLLKKHQADFQAEAVQAKYVNLQTVSARVSYAMDEFQKATVAYDAAQRQGLADSLERHRLWNESPYDLADALARWFFRSLLFKPASRWVGRRHV